MSNTVITNYTDLNGPSTKTDSSVVVIVNKDGSLSVDQNLLDTLMGTDGSQAAGISVVRVGHEGKPDDATDSENEDEKIPHVTLSVDSYYDEPDSIIKYDSGAEMLQSLRIETRENSLVGFQNDHCYTPLKSPSQTIPQRSEQFKFDDPVIEITHTPPPKPVTPKKITILEQKIIPKGKKIVLNTTEPSIILKSNDILTKPLPVFTKSKVLNEVEKPPAVEENTESSSISSSGDSTADRDSDSDYKETKEKTATLKPKKPKSKPRILKSATKIVKTDFKLAPKLKINKTILKKDIKEKLLSKNPYLEKKQLDLDNLIPATTVTATSVTSSDPSKLAPKLTPKVIKKDKKTPAHMSALLTDMTSLFSTPDVIRRVSTENKVPSKTDKETVQSTRKSIDSSKPEFNEEKPISQIVSSVTTEETKPPQKTYLRQIKIGPNIAEKSRGYDPMPQLDDASLAQILQDNTPQPMKVVPSISSANIINSPGLAGPLSPTLDLLAGLQPEEDGLTEDLLMHVAQLVESSENLQEVIDKQVLGKVETPAKVPEQQPYQQAQTPSNPYTLPIKTVKSIIPRKDPIEIVRRDGRVITLPPIEAPATRSSKRKNQLDTSNTEESAVIAPTTPTYPIVVTPEPIVQHISKQYSNKKLLNKKPEPIVPAAPVEKITAESQESWNSEDDPNRIWCICKQPHNNRFMICCDACEDWFHGKCVNITKAMGQQMEEQGIEWRCPNCVKKTPSAKNIVNKVPTMAKDNAGVSTSQPAITKELTTKTTCIVCKKPARASSIYCSDACILKHAQDSLGSQSASKTDTSSGKPLEKSNSESRVIVYERKSGRLLAGPNAPTAENLKIWLQKNPTFEVVRPGTLSAIKPNVIRKKPSLETNKIQTTLNFARIPRKSAAEQSPLSPQIKTPQPEPKEKMLKSLLPSPREEVKTTPRPKTPVTPKPQQQQLCETPKSSNKVASEPKKLVRSTLSRSQSLTEKPPAVSPSTSRRKDSSERKPRMSSEDPIRDNVKKSLQEQISIRMAESDGSKFTEEEIQQFAFETELELHELFNRDVGMKYKAKYRSLMFNIKDRKNLSLWEKIRKRVITPKQLVRLSPEELASQELAEWRDQQEKHQLELIKKSEIDLLAASKTYVLKTHKGEEVMQTKESVSTELDPNVPVEDLVSALNDAVGDGLPPDSTAQTEEPSKKDTAHKKHGIGKKKDKQENGNSSKKKEKRELEKKKSRSSRRKSELKEKERRSSRRAERKISRSRSKSKEKLKTEVTKEKARDRSRSRQRSRSRAKSKRRSREHSRSNSRSRARSRSLRRSSRRSTSKDSVKRRVSREEISRSKRRRSSDEKSKLRSRSQEPVYIKSKNDSTDSDSIERPKSAMMKEIHPEYDPHEPMITSAFSEEDLRKSREDVYDDSYKNEVSEYGNVDYDAAKSFSINTNEGNVTLSPPQYLEKQDKISAEAESDQEPTSTVEHSAATVWNGCINMVDVARFYVAAHEVSGNALDLEDDLSPELDIVGRINPDTVWDYISKMKRASNKDIVILKLQAANDEEKMQYIALYSYLSSRNRLGVVKVSNTATIKDLYIVPAPANTPLPSVLLPLDGPGVGELKTHLLIAIIIRQRKKRAAASLPKDIVPAKVARESRKKSYTPPLSPRRRALPLPTYTTPALSNSVMDKIAASLAAADVEEAYSPGSSSGSSSAPDTLRNKMEELNRQIEEQKQQILKMAQADSSGGGENEAYSPSRPITPPSPVVPLADIALPSNLQEILATIKQRSESNADVLSSTDVDMRTLPPLP
ncbi:death-inducer obliterator 1 isoform X1 [Pararge aegeria]|uniref:death-inducer obliterator 1 isoform X1 n=1 Tax=Pararge aegeria TaxID=116150 RepID=UPI0019D152E4|nr:death-inducer obliterator 1 isoform X1 [Pararge aegeria]